MGDNQTFKHKHKENLCFHCNELHKNIKKYTIKDRYDDCHETIFDGDDFTIHLCPSCSEELEIKDDWFDNEKSYNPELDTYNNEDDIIRLINLLPIHNQEYVLNIDNEINGIKKIDRYDWIRGAMSSLSI